MIERNKMGETMRKCRKAMGMSLAELARLSGVTESTIRNWEVGRTVPAMDALMLVAKALGLGVDAYVGNAPLPKGWASSSGRWIELVCFARDPAAAELVRPIVYLCSRCGRLQYEKTKTCICGSAMSGVD